MVLTKIQEQGLKIAVDRYKHNEAYTCIAGYAGTGKSTLINFIVDALNIPKEKVCYIAYTGKAALVLKEKGCTNAMTAHRLLYQSYPRDDGTFYHKVRRPIDGYDLIVVDEISMLPEDMWDLLLSHGIHVIALGDPFQLPAITKNNNVLDHPHIFLDEIMRQAQESEIVRLTMSLREFKPLELTQGNELMVVDFKDLNTGMYTWADQVIAATNATRRYINNTIRELKFNVKDTMPIENDRVICLRNYWDHPSAMGDVMVNGSIGYLANPQEVQAPFIRKAIKADFLPEEYTDEDFNLSPIDLAFRDLNMDHQLLTEGEPTVNKKNWKKIPKRYKPFEFDYAYCITCWKAQGSEYNKVLVLEEGFPYDKIDHYKYLYTAATRAKEKLVIVRDKI